MALDSVIREENENKQVMVDIPVEVQAPIVEEPKDSFWIKYKKWIIIVSGALILLTLIGGLMWRSLSSNADLVILAPQGSKPVATLTPTTIIASLSGELANIPYVSTSGGFSIIPPDGWIKDESGKTSATVIFLSPNPKNIGNRGYATTISVETDKAEAIKLDDQVSEIKKGLFQTYPDFNFEDDLLMYLQGRPFYLLGGTYVLDGVNLRKRTLITIYDNRGFAISASGPVLTWSDYESVITKSLFSFKIL